MRKKSFMAALVLICFLLSLSGCGPQEQETTTTEEPHVVPVEVAQVSKGDVAITDKVTGYLAPNLEVNVVPKMAGKVAKVNVKVGDRVKAGQVLVELDASELNAQLKQAQAALNSAKIQLEGALASAQTNYDAAKRELERMQYLYEQGGISEQQFQATKTQYELARVQLENAKKSNLEQAEAAVELIRTQLANTVVTAPASGIVTEVNVKAGELAGQTMPVVKIVDMDTVLATFNLTESQIKLVKKGDKLAVRVPAATDEELTGTVQEVSPVAGPQTKAFTVKVALANKNHQLKPGMSAELSLTLQKVAQALVVPVDALMAQEEETYLYVVNNDTARRQKVKVLLENDTLAAVKGELQAGQWVVVVGKEQLEDNAQVKVVNGGNS